MLWAVCQTHFSVSYDMAPLFCMRWSCGAAGPVPFTPCAMSQASDPAVSRYRTVAVNDAPLHLDRIADVSNHHASGVAVALLAQVCGIQGSDCYSLYTQVPLSVPVVNADIERGHLASRCTHPSPPRTHTYRVSVAVCWWSLPCTSPKDQGHYRNCQATLCHAVGYLPCTLVTASYQMVLFVSHAAVLRCCCSCSIHSVCNVTGIGPSGGRI
jgi:hypothetical protein